VFIRAIVILDVEGHLVVTEDGRPLSDAGRPRDDEPTRLLSVIDPHAGTCPNVEVLKDLWIDDLDGCDQIAPS
jgi:hypothetical protein